MADIILLPKDVARFRVKIGPATDTGCVPWAGARVERGYGVFRLDHKNVYAHRVAWALANGAVPQGLCVLHRCDNPPCVNPDHLVPGTHRDNAEDKCRKGRFSNGRERLTHCHRGHPFDGDNVRRDTLGRRVCVACRKAYLRVWHAAHPGKQAEYDARRKG